MECMSDADLNPLPIDPVPAPKALKACRRCARLKMKCDSKERVPCSRCQKARVDCHTDPVSRQARSYDIEIVDRQKVAGLESQVEALRKEINALQNERRQQVGQQAPRIQRQDDIFDNNELQDETQFNELTAEEMAAPIAAVDAMASISAGSGGECEANSGTFSHSEDLVTRGVVSEEHARILYDMFLGGSQPWIPIFDPVTDNFDSLRSRSTYCFTVVLMLAVQRSSETRDDVRLLVQCQDEVRRLAGDTLFNDPANIESVQGMLLHAAYSEKTWFARGHALQMAIHLNFSSVFKDLRRSIAKTRDSPSLKRKDRVTISKARTWLAIYSMEQEAASGSSRLPRINGPDEDDRQDFLDYPLTEPQDVRLVANIELNHLRQRFRQRIELLSPTECLATIQASDTFEELDSWHERWDNVYTSHGFHRKSFQRSSMILQLNYTKIFVLCSILGRLQKEGRSMMWPEQDEAALAGATSGLLSVMIDQLTLFLDIPVYKWQLKWAPSYSVVTIAFTAVFAIKIAHLHPDLVDTASLLEKCGQVAEVLRTIPYTSFYRLLSLLIKAPFKRIRTTSERAAQNQETGIVVQASTWMPTDFCVDDFAFADQGEGNLFNFDQMWSMDQQQQQQRQRQRQQPPLI